MKTMLGFLITSAALAAGVFAQQLSPHKVPASVTSSFHSKFKGVSKVEWKRKSDQNYEAEFKVKGVEVAAKFDQEGRWLWFTHPIFYEDIIAPLPCSFDNNLNNHIGLENEASKCPSLVGALCVISSFVDDLVHSEKS